MPWIHSYKVHNRIAEIMAHTTRYAFKGESRLASDSGVSKSTICRLLSGKVSPSYVLIALVTRCLERELGRRIDPRELVSLDGTYPTSSVCALAGCSGCLPEDAYDDSNNLRSGFRNAARVVFGRGGQ